jgi:hypothetical protein
MLLSSIVNIPFQALPLLVLRGYQPCAGNLQLVRSL